MTVEKAIEAVQQLLAAYWRPFPQFGVVRLYTWGGKGDSEYKGNTPADPTKRHPAVGFRVAEVSFSAIDPVTHLGGGESYMQSSPGNGEVCFCAERAVLARVDGWPTEDVIDEDWKLLRAVHGDEIAREYVDQLKKGA